MGLGGARHGEFELELSCCDQKDQDVPINIRNESGDVLAFAIFEPLIPKTVT